MLKDVISKIVPRFKMINQRRFNVSALVVSGILPLVITASSVLWSDQAVAKRAKSIPKNFVRLYTENAAPFNMSKEGNEYEHKEHAVMGLSTEIVQELFKRTKIPYSIKLRNWSRSYDIALNKERVGVFSTTLTAKREPFFKWVGPIAQDGWVIYARGDSDIKISSIDDLNNYIVGGYKNDAVSVFLESKGVKMSLLPSDDLNPHRLSNGQIELWAAGNMSGFYFARQQGYPDVKQVFTIRETDLYIALNKNFPQQEVDKLNKTLAEMEETGIIDRIKATYR